MSRGYITTYQQSITLNADERTCIWVLNYNKSTLVKLHLTRPLGWYTIFNWYMTSSYLWRHDSLYWTRGCLFSTHWFEAALIIALFIQRLQAAMSGVCLPFDLSRLRKSNLNPSKRSSQRKLCLPWCLVTSAIGFDIRDWIRRYISTANKSLSLSATFSVKRRSGQPNQSA